MKNTNKISLQDKFGPKNMCFGCGPSNEKGLQIKSHVSDRQVISSWTPKPEHEAFPQVLCGGIIGTILDCHANWAGAWYIYQHTGRKDVSLYGYCSV